MTTHRIFAAVAFAAGIIASNQALAKSDTDFLTDTIKGDNSEVALGTLARQKGDSKGVKAFGQTLVKDHGKAKKQALAVGKKLGVAETDDLTDEATAEMTKLNGLSGAAFDQEFTTYMVSDHQKDIAEFRDEAKTGSSKVAKLAKKTLPTLEKHLKIAQSLAKP
ncbi:MULTISPECIES: DUF4142 domain-containing protein [unclassified Mesorhizobium]|uniref:DUF4142 domain-containing protein n=1 Tax=unclassified Mesorhizobium TaxID=325217 RepID=UPI0011285EBE|nr:MULTISPECIES: DUF4142 domain-containing protein [unclassified Mesorhizobium]MBZ9974213.1 DUF4142 domain-containing protein [Mesorhizobium sp. BR-1-1-10]TPK10289.1 DUF4142 domain-containing protein [Mesorhizobium sp. B2-5-7]